jgi:phosphate starvation-inducible protein PhoH
MKRSQKVRQEKPIPQPKYQFSIPSIKPITSNQSLFMDALRTKQLVIADGSSGTGKTYLACYWAAKNLIERNIKKIVLLRCYQPLAGRTIGFVPGDATEKLMPYYKQMVDYLEEFLGKAKTEIYLKNNEIEICSLENIRGRSWDNTIVIVDESQGLFIPEVQALITRIGEYSQMILVEDVVGIIVLVEERQRERRLRFRKDAHIVGIHPIISQKLNHILTNTVVARLADKRSVHARTSQRDDCIER